MKLTEDMKKEAILEVIRGFAAEYPEFATPDEKLTKKELIEWFDGVLAANKANLFRRLLTEMPDAVMVPVYDIMLRLEHPIVPTLTFEVRAVEGQLGSVLIPIERMVRQWRRPEDDTNKITSARLKSTPIKDVPEWAFEQVVALLQDGTLKLFTTATEMETQVVNTPGQQGSLLDTNIGVLDMKVVYAKNTNAANPPILVEPVGQFKTAEQEAAWNVINGIVDGEFALPDDPTDISGDPRTITTVEVQHVDRRIRRCLQSPERFTARPTSARLFDQKTFFNQLLQIEFSGFTPRRHDLAKNGGRRPRILKLIRKIAVEQGFEVISDYVINRQERGVVQNLIPNQPFTDNRTPKLPFKDDIGTKAAVVTDARYYAAKP
jgi:hypothetical protein